MYLTSSSNARTKEVITESWNNVYHNVDYFILLKKYKAHVTKALMRLLFGVDCLDVKAEKGLSVKIIPGKLHTHEASLWGGLP